MKIMESITRENLLEYIQERLKVLKDNRSEDIMKISGQIKELVLMRDEIERS